MTALPTTSVISDMDTTHYRTAVLHGAGYVGGELIRLLLHHPHADLRAATSRTFAGEPLWKAHPALRGETELTFTAGDEMVVDDLDVVFVAAEHGQGAAESVRLLEAGFDGLIVDLSADFRFSDASQYTKWFGFAHPAPHLLSSFVYGLPEVNAPYPRQTKRIANPGCFATGIALALYPLATNLHELDAAVTALTGASGSGAQPKATTHFPTRDGNLRAYKVLEHQHLPEVRQILGDNAHVSFVPVSGPWTRGIWGTAQIKLPEGTLRDEVDSWYEEAYSDAPFVRCWPGALPELRFAVNTPFCDIGWMVRDGRLVVAFAIDNLLKGAAGQAVHNFNLLLGLHETVGLLSASSRQLDVAAQTR